MADRQRQEDEVDEKDDSKDQGDNEQGSGGSGIHKYFGKSNKSPKLLTDKIKKSFRLQNNQQNITLLLQTTISSQKQLRKAQQKTKLKCQYRWNSEFLNTKPKFKITFNPFLPNRLIEEALINWKSVIDKANQQNVDIKFNDKKQLNLKYKRTGWRWEKRLRNRLEVQTTFESDTNVKGSLSFQSMLKSSLYEDYKYLNSSQVKSKMSLRDMNYNQFSSNFNIKFDFQEKLTFIINQFRAKQQTKLNMTFLGPKQTVELKSNVELTNPANTWTLYGGVYGYKWGLAFDELKFVYSLYENWKVGCMFGQKNSWEFMIQNLKLNKPYCNSIALHIGNKNYALVLKNRFNKRNWGKVNFEFTLQNALKNTQLDKVNFGLNANFNV